MCQEVFISDHFSLRYFSPEQVGKKAVEINVSDIGAMSAKPKYFLVSLVSPGDNQRKGC
ncbi:MAG: hypothetical protein FJW63_00995 [Actinobacteria bacterium]|nr:hypothetical protein [Actinomycetota bacterium]